VDDRTWKGHDYWNETAWSHIATTQPASDAGHATTSSSSQSGSARRRKPSRNKIPASLIENRAEETPDKDDADATAHLDPETWLSCGIPPAPTDLLTEALELVNAVGLDMTEHLDGKEYKEMNKKFKIDLTNFVGREHLVKFRETSSEFLKIWVRNGQSIAGVAIATTYATEVLQVFSTAWQNATTRKQRLPQLLCDLILLLPERGLRHALHREFTTMHGMCSMIGNTEPMNAPLPNHSCRQSFYPQKILDQSKASSVEGACLTLISNSCLAVKEKADGCDVEATAGAEASKVSPVRTGWRSRRVAEQPNVVRTSVASAE